MLPTPDCRGSSDSGILPCLTSHARKSRMWPAIWLEAASGTLKALLRSGELVGTTATTLSRGTSRYGVPMRWPAETRGMGCR
ncbi:hypothetical protein D3C86_1662700 [compost metagenome]